jgi:uncharacterized protein
MFISLEDLEQKPVDFREQFAPGQVEFGPELRQLAPLSSSGRATLIEEHQGAKEVIQDIRVVGEMSTRVEVACARCLDPVARDIDRSFDLLYRPQGSDAGRSEISVTQAEAEIGYYTGDGVLLEDILREQLLLEVPIKVVCREDCKGLCPHCGQNRNQGSCDCKMQDTDPRWNALGDLRDKLKH